MTTALLSPYQARRWMASFGIESRLPSAEQRLMIHGAENEPRLRAMMFRFAPQPPDKAPRYLLVSWFVDEP